jgi:LysM repeat protein
LLWPFKILYRLAFYVFYVPFYRGSCWLKKITTKTPNSTKEIEKKSLIYYIPLVITLVIGSVIVINNLLAKETRPEDYGNQNILYKITSGGEQYDEDLSQPITEGPLLNDTSAISYLGNEALTGEPNTPLNEQVPDSLAYNPDDQSALAAPEFGASGKIAIRRREITNYAVQAGDTISTIAKKFGVNINTLLWENNLTAYSMIKPGQILRVLPVSGLSYKVKSGDTLQKIAKTYQADIDQIIDYNELASATAIKIGQTLVIPKGVKPVTYAANYGTSQNNASIKNIFLPPAAVNSSTRLQWPTNTHYISQYYGWRHTGVDIANKTGSPIYAAESGKVEVAGWNNGGYGNYTIINHGGGIKTLYGHQSKILVKAGDVVNRGQVIGLMGSTGRSTGPHLHFEVRVNGAFKNPLNYIR